MSVTTLCDAPDCNNCIKINPNATDQEIISYGWKVKRIKCQASFSSRVGSWNVFLCPIHVNHPQQLSKKLEGWEIHHYKCKYEPCTNIIDWCSTVDGTDPYVLLTPGCFIHHNPAGFSEITFCPSHYHMGPATVEKYERIEEYLLKYGQSYC